MKLRVQLMAFAGLFAGVVGLRAQTTFTWSQTPATQLFEDAANWGGTAPTTGGALVFGPSSGTTVKLNASIDVAGITFNSAAAAYPSYGFGSPNASILGVGSGGIVMTNTGPGYVNFGSDMALKLNASQTWNVGTSWTLDVMSNVSGAFTLTKSGDGSLTLGGTNTFSGGLVVNGGWVQAGSTGALGATTGSVIINATGASSYASVEIGTTQQTIGSLTFGGSTGAANSYNSLGMSTTGRLTLGGDVTFDGSGRQAGAYISGGTLLLGGNRKFNVVDSPYTSSELMITSRIEGDGAVLTKTGAGSLYLSSVNAYTGGTVVNGGTLSLVTSGALPAGGNVVVNAIGGQASLEVSGSTQSIGTLTFGGDGATAFGRNRVTIFGGSIALNGLAYVATNGPAGARVEGGTLDLGIGTTSRMFDVADSLNADADVTITSLIIGTSPLAKNGTGTLLLTGNNTFSGGLTVGAGTLVLAAPSIRNTTGELQSGAAGVGTLTLSSGTTLIGRPNSGYDSLLVANPVSLATNVTLGTSQQGDGPRLEFSGPVTASAAATSINLAADSGAIFTGSLAGASANTSLTFRSGTGPRGAVLLAGTTAATISSITADHAGVLFGNANAVPGTLTTVAATNNGYIGVVAMDSGAVPSPATVLARITDRTNFSGTFGLDTFSETIGAQVFADNLDLTGFGAGFTLGSMSGAVITGTITPPAVGYAFGNGGGVLVVRSSLADAGGSKSVSVNSVTATEQGPLLAVFQGNNTYSGAFSVSNSGAILDSATALPAGRGVTLGANGYLGYTEAFTGVPNFAAFAARVTSHVSTSVLGFDSNQWISSAISTGNPDPYAARWVNETIDLTNYAPIYLGSATRAVFAGTVIAPNQSGANRTLSLIGVGDGTLEVRSKLATGNVNQVVVGAPGTSAGYGVVKLSGQNTYAGGTTLHSGTLALGASNVMSGTTILSGPLGTGPLTVSNSGNFPTLTASAYGNTVLNNPILLGGPLQLGSIDDDGMPAAAMSTATSTSFGYYDQLVLGGVISNLSSTEIGTLHIRGDTVLSGANTFSGGVVLEFGELVIGHNSALGTGPLNINPMPLGGGSGWAEISTGNAARTIANNVIINAPPYSYIAVGGNGSLTITGTVTLGPNPTFAPQQHPLFLNGPVNGSSTFRSQGFSPIVLNNVSPTPSSYAGGTVAETGAIIFGTANSIPATGLLSSYWNGYIGIAQPALQGTFLNRFNRVDTDGTIGFDTLTAGTTNTFTGAVDLTGFDSGARLGSATRAILTGSITPQGMSYNFGGGGGILEVNTALTNPSGTTGARSVYVTSSGSAPLTVRLTGSNTYTGDTSVYGSALIFKSGSMPASGNLSADMGGYIGSEDTAFGTTPQTFIDRFNPAMRGGIIGFDSPGSTLAVNGAISLARFSSGSDPRIFLGTATSASLGGAITLPELQNVYRFAGYKGGQLTVTSTLDGARSVEIGDVSTPATFRSPLDSTGPLSTVTLAGANAYTLGTSLYGGALGIGHNSALGSGKLTVRGMYMPGDYDSMPLLFASGGARELTNLIALESDLELGGVAGGTNMLTLGGAISGLNSLYKTGPGTVVLSGANTFSGGTIVRGGNVSFGHLTAAGTGMLELTGPSSPSATFTQTATVHGIAGDAGLITIADGRTLTINQQFSATYAGQFSLGTGSSLVYGGPSSTSPTTLRLTGANTYAGGTTIQGGVTLLAGANTVFGAATNTVTLNGGGVMLDPGVTLSNPLTLNSGTLGGGGTFSTGGTLRIKPGVMLAPGGYHGPATLTFAGTSLSLEGGAYRWQLADASPTGTWDRIDVGGSVAIVAGTTPFTFKIVPAGALDLVGSVANFNPYAPQSWSVLTASAITVSGALADAFSFDTGHVASLIAGGSFSFSLNSTNTSLILNFTPVPEPSTYVLLGMGAAVLAFAHRRRRRR